MFKGVNVRLMGSYWNHTDFQMFKFLKSLRDDSGMGYHGTIETVSSVVIQAEFAIIKCMCAGTTCTIAWE